jgi:hypothetical protein
MATRATMTTLIAKLRTMIGDVATPPTWTDEALEAFLDRRSATTDDLTLTATRRPDGRVALRAPCGDWEADAALFTAGAALSVAESFPERGEWIVASLASGATVVLIGKLFDLAAAAADALEAQAATVMSQFDLSAGDKSLKLSQPHKQILDQAARFREQSAEWDGRDFFGDGIGSGLILSDEFTPGYGRRFL